MGIENCRVLGTESGSVGPLPRGGSGATGVGQRARNRFRGVLACHGHGNGSLPGKAQGFRRQDIVERHGGIEATTRFEGIPIDIRDGLAKNLERTAWTGSCREGNSPVARDASPGKG